MTQNASLKPANMKSEKKASVTNIKDGRKAPRKSKDVRQTDAFKKVMTDVRPHLETLCDALRLHRGASNRIFSKTKRTITDALLVVTKERKDGLTRQRETVRKAQDKVKAKKEQDRIEKVEKRLNDLKAAQARHTKRTEGE